MVLRTGSSRKGKEKLYPVAKSTTSMFSSVVPSSKTAELSVNSFTFGFNTTVPERRQNGSSSLIITLNLELAAGKKGQQCKYLGGT